MGSRNSGMVYAQWKGKPNDGECSFIACTALLAPIVPGMLPEEEGGVG